MNIAFFRRLGKGFLRLLSNEKFPGSAEYWENRYHAGGNSGAGSYNTLAEFKAGVINNFISEYGIIDSLEFGCGDGNNLKLIKYPKYIGLDVSPTAVANCISAFSEDTTKSFYLYNSISFRDNHKLFVSELTLSLDVIYHLVEEDVFNAYMGHLFGASQKYVIIYSTNFEGRQKFHERNRTFTNWILQRQPHFRLIKQIENPYKYDALHPNETSNAEFYIYENIRD